MGMGGGMGSETISVEPVKDAKSVRIKVREGTDSEFSFVLSADEITLMIRSLAEVSTAFPIKIPASFDGLPVHTIKNTLWQINADTRTKELRFSFFHHALGPLSFIFETESATKISNFLASFERGANITQKKRPQKNKQTSVTH